MCSKVEEMPVSEIRTETGSMRVATPETTAFDLVRYPAAAGHLSNAATVLAELAERIDARDLVGIAPLVRLPDVQRLGYLLEAIGEGGIAAALHAWLVSRRARIVPLRPGFPTDLEANHRWRVVPNAEVEVEP
jgi:hypothetical protein